MFALAKATAQRAAHKAALSLGALMCYLVGLGFLTATAWIYLSTVGSPMFAALLISGVYLGAGFILTALSASVHPTDPVTGHAGMDPAGTRPATGAPATPLTDAFMMGLKAGQSARRS